MLENNWVTNVRCVGWTYARKKRFAQERAHSAAVSTFNVVFPNVTAMQSLACARAYSSGVKSPSGPIKKETAFGDFSSLKALRRFLFFPARLGIIVMVVAVKCLSADVKSVTG